MNKITSDPIPRKPLAGFATVLLLGFILSLPLMGAACGPGNAGNDPYRTDSDAYAERHEALEQKVEHDRRAQEEADRAQQKAEVEADHARRGW